MDLDKVLITVDFPVPVSPTTITP